jgi:mRNA interferase MazF
LIRGDVILVSAPGEFGKPRPAVVVQSNFLAGAIESVIVCPLTSTMSPTPRIRPTILPDPENGLRQPSQAMADKIMAVHVRRLGKIGHLAPSDMAKLNRAVEFVLGFLDLGPAEES